jgi:hypothetical protein
MTQNKLSKFLSLNYPGVNTLIKIKHLNKNLLIKSMMINLKINFKLSPNKSKKKKKKKKNNLNK